MISNITVYLKNDWRWWNSSDPRPGYHCRSKYIFNVTTHKKAITILENVTTSDTMYSIPLKLLGKFYHLTEECRMSVAVAIEK